MAGRRILANYSQRRRRFSALDEFQRTHGENPEARAPLGSESLQSDEEIT